MRRIGLFLLSALVAVATCIVPVSAESLDPPELRAVWVDAFHDGFKTPQQVDDLVTWARSANLNALFVQVRRRGDAYSGTQPCVQLARTDGRCGRHLVDVSR